MGLTRTPTQPNPTQLKQMLNNPAMLRDIAHGADPAATARFVGPYLVVTGPSGSG